MFRPFTKKLAATYSRGVYKTTTIGKTVFDGRVRNGNGSDHSFMATKNLESDALGHTDKLLKNIAGLRRFSENCTQAKTRITIRELNRYFSFKEGKKAIKPHDRLVLVR